MKIIDIGLLSMPLKSSIKARRLKEVMIYQGVGRGLVFVSLIRVISHLEFLFRLVLQTTEQESGVLVKEEC